MFKKHQGFWQWMGMMSSCRDWFKGQDPITRMTMGILAFAILLRFLITCFVTAAGDSYAHLSKARYIAQTWTIPLFEPIYRPFFYYPPAFHVATSVMYTLFSAFGERVATKAM